MAKPVEFTETNPLTIRVHKDNGFWDIEVDNTLKAKMNTRGRGPSAAGPKGDMPTLDAEYQSRRSAGAPPLPRFKMDPGHTPIVMREGEAVKFVCDPPRDFAVWVDRDVNVSPNSSAPGNPFGWKLPKSEAAGNVIGAIVSLPNAGFGPADQRFYKFTAWIRDGADTITVDPDGYCDR